MQTKELIELLRRFDPDSEVHLCMSLPGRVIQTHEGVWVADYGGGPQLNASLDFKQFHVYAGCGIEQLVANVPQNFYRLRHLHSEMDNGGENGQSFRTSVYTCLPQVLLR